MADFEIGPGTVWREVFEMLASAEQPCVRDAVGAELDRVLSREILNEDEVSEQQLAFLPCLPPQILRPVFLTGMMLGVEDDGVPVAEDQEAWFEKPPVVEPVHVLQGGVLDLVPGPSTAPACTINSTPQHH